MEVIVWHHGDVDGGGPAKVDTSICSEDGLVEDGNNTCECAGPVCAPVPVGGSVEASDFRC